MSGRNVRPQRRPARCPPGDRYSGPGATERPRSTGTINTCEWSHKLPKPASLRPGPRVCEQPESRPQSSLHAAPPGPWHAAHLPSWQGPQLTGHHGGPGTRDGTAPPNGCPTAVQLRPPRPPWAELCTQRHLGQRGTNTPPQPSSPRSPGSSCLASLHAAPNTPGPPAAMPVAVLLGLHGAGLHRKNTKVKPSVVKYLRRNTSSCPTAETGPPAVRGTQGGSRAGEHCDHLCQCEFRVWPWPQ